MTEKNKSSKPYYHILEIDPYLTPFSDDIALRMSLYEKTKKAILGKHTRLTEIANGYLYYGFHKTDAGWYYREWAPHAKKMHLIGDFNGWNHTSHPMKKDASGNWEIFLPGADALQNGQRIKVLVTSEKGSEGRIPAYIRKLTQDPETFQFYGQIFEPETPFCWTDSAFSPAVSVPPLIYECHVGMAQEKEGIGTYREFADNILSWVKDSGYNAVQLMGIMEHPYYASFGYQVSSFFAASSWFGTPDDLKYLINKAHGMGLAVLLDLVHSHASKNTVEGLCGFDGSDDQYFHPGARGNHPAWDSKLFQYGRHEVLHFLLSNVKFWLTEYHFDGFRFDGVTSMLYRDHGLGEAFDSYQKYFSLNTDTEAITYLQLANELIREVKPHAITVAEDMSGMPGMCLPVKDGGIGFDYRLAMGVPDYWIHTLRDVPYDNWDMGKMWYELTTRRPGEKNIGYAESHDQALVGDKTIMFWLADKEMYTSMDKIMHNPTIDRAMALHKMIRLVTCSLAGEGYLNFMGNEFGHPEWIDFPREGNGWSFQYARRQWSLAKNGYLKYESLHRFDEAMLDIIKKYDVLEAGEKNLLKISEQDKVLVYEKGGLIFAFNFHPFLAMPTLFVPVPKPGAYRVVLSTDEERFNGEGHIRMDLPYPAETGRDERTGFEVYLPSRSAAVLVREK